MKRGKFAGFRLVTAGLTDAHSHATLSELLIDKALVATAFAATITSDMPTRTALGQLAVNDALGHTPPDTFGEWAQQRAEFYGKEDRQALLKPVGATITHLALGDKLELNRDMSGVAGYDQILESFMKKAASAFGLSYESLSGDYSKSSYTAARLGEALPYEKTLKRRKQIAERIYATVYALWLEEQHMRGLIYNSRPGARLLERARFMVRGAMVRAAESFAGRISHGANRRVESRKQYRLASRYLRAERRRLRRQNSRDSGRAQAARRAWFELAGRRDLAERLQRKR